MGAAVKPIQPRIRRTLVHRQREAVATDATLVAQRLLERVAQHDADVLGGVVGVDVQVALGAHRDVDQAVARELLQHVVKETDAGLDIVFAGAIEVDGGGDARLLGGAAHRRPPATGTGGRDGRSSRLGLRSGLFRGLSHGPLLQKAGLTVERNARQDDARQHDQAAQDACRSERIAKNRG